MITWLSRHRIIRALLVCCLVLLLTAFGFIRYRMWGPHRGYELDVLAPAPGQWPAPGVLEAGAAIRDITPDLDAKDSWTDVDGNNSFNPKIDHYEDRNENGDFDLVWLGGFGVRRAAKGVNDPLWVRAIAFRNNGVTLALVSLDSIGITHEHYITIRKMIQEVNPGIDHVVFSATHTHNAPDTMGLWSYSYLWMSRFDEAYLAFVRQAACDAVLEAVERLEPATATVATAMVPQENFTRDSRKPVVVDNQLPLAWVRRQDNGESIAVLASWGMHPEALGGRNPLISSDFVHYFREAVEKGLDGPAAFEGFGGHCIFFVGPVGGLMTQLGLPITDRHGQEHKEDSVEKARAQGENLAILANEALRNPESQPMEDQRVAYCARTVYTPIGWPFKAALYWGLIHPGVYGGRARTEVNALRIGELEIVTTPGELFPEIFFGGIESPDGADYPGPPVEIPPIIEAMGGTVKMNFNLANDQIGYIVPKSQWDRKPPYTYGRKSAPYGEVYTGSAEVAPTLHLATLEVLTRLHETLQN